MLHCEGLTLDGKIIKDMSIDGKVCYATYPDYKEQINEYAWSVLSNSLSVGSGHYNYPGTSTRYDYNIYSTFDEGGYTGAGAGNVRPFVVSPHILASAQHYPNKPTGNITIGGTTIKRVQWVNLKEWALANGYTQSDVSGIYEFGDIALCKCDKATAIPDDCIPYFISKDRINQLFFSQTVNGCIGWRSPQTYGSVANHAYAVPMIFTSQTQWTSLKNCESYTLPDEWKQKFVSMGNLYNATEGDSGRIAYLMFNNKPILITACTYPNAGPDYCAAHDILKEFVKQYEGTDCLKEI